MNNSTVLWRVLLLVAVVLTGALLALPNWFGSDPAVQISGRDAEIDTGVQVLVRGALNEAGLTPAETRDDEGRLLILFDDEDTQLRARDAIASALDPNDYTVALNLVSASPAWLRKVGEPMSL